MGATGTSTDTYQNLLAGGEDDIANSLSKLLARGQGQVGDGSDGALVYDGVATILGMAPSSNVYTLTRDIFATNLTVNAGVTIITAGYRIFATGLLLVSATGFIQQNGNAAAGATGGAALAQNGDASQYGGSATMGTAGATGVTTAAAGAAGTNQAASASAGGAGGAGGSSVSGANAGGAGGTVATPTIAQKTIRSLPGALLGRFPSNASVVAGAGGGAGAGDGTNLAGGGGGGGGALFISALKLSNLGTIRANGGAGGNAAGAGNSGGGGGGGGGYVVLVYAGLVGGTIGTVQANGGAAGTGFGTGVAGVAGSAGIIVQLAL